MPQSPNANEIFTVIVLILSAAVSSFIAHGYGTRRAKEMFALLVLLLMVGCQLFHLINASLYIPATRFFIWKPRLHRSDCILSAKGGKREGNSTAWEDLNPCFCKGTASCLHVVSKEVINTDSCPWDGTAKCRQDDHKIHRFVSNLRDCRGGQQPVCSKDEPCTPCGREQLPLWRNQGRCRSCSKHNMGDCLFVPGQGPYCLKAPDSKEVEPCKRCCTDPEPLFVNSTTCY